MPPGDRAVTQLPSSVRCRACSDRVQARYRIGGQPQLGRGDPKGSGSRSMRP